MSAERFSLESLTWIKNANLSASYTSQAIPCEKFKTLQLALQWAAVALTNGSFKFQGSIDGVSYFDLTLDDANKVYGTNYTFSAPSATLTITTTAGSINLIFENPFRYVRVVYTVVAGGAANQLQGKFFGQG